MSTPFYDLASMVVLPSGYKSGKIYAQKPLTTDGQLTFTRASTATRVNASGLIETVASGVPRLDYQGSTCPKLLLEPQRTNLVTYSEQIDNAAWTKASGSGGTLPVITANYGVSPDGYMNADRVQLQRTSSTFSYSQVKQNLGTTGQQYTVSVYLKSLSGTPTISIASDGNSFAYYATLTNEWVRYTATFTSTGTPSAELTLYQQATSTSLTADFLAWGFQVEAGAYATSYIPTTSAAVTRLADGTGTGDVFGKTFTLSGDFGLYWEGVINGNNSYPFFYSGGNYAAGSDYRSYFTYTSTNLQLYGVGEALTGRVAVSLTAGTYYKILVKRVGSTIKWYVNGTEYANASGFTTTTVKMRSLFGSTLGGPNHESVAKALIFETTLSDAQGIELTTL